MNGYNSPLKAFRPQGMQQQGQSDWQSPLLNPPLRPRPTMLPAGQQNSSYPFAPGSDDHAFAQLRYTNHVNQNGLMNDAGAAASVKNNGFMPSTTVGGAWGQSHNASDGFAKAQARERQAGSLLTQAMQQRADRVGLYSDAQRERDAIAQANMAPAPTVASNAQAMVARTANRPLQNGGPLRISPSGGLMGTPQAEIDAVRRQYNLPVSGRRAMPTPEYQQELKDRKARVLTNAMERGNARQMRLGTPQMYGGADPVYAQAMQQQMVNQPLQIAQAQQQAALSLAQANHANNLDVARIGAQAKWYDQSRQDSAANVEQHNNMINAAIAAETDPGKRATLQGMLKRIEPQQMPSFLTGTPSPSWAQAVPQPSGAPDLRGYNPGASPILSALPPPAPSAAPWVSPLTNPPQAPGMRSVGPPTAQSQLGPAIAATMPAPPPAPRPSPLLAAATSMAPQPAVPQGPGPLLAAAAAMTPEQQFAQFQQTAANQSRLHLGGKLNDVEKAKLDKMFDEGDYTGMRAFEQAYQIDPLEMNKYTAQRGNGLLGYLGRDVNIHAPGFAGRIDNSSGQSYPTILSSAWQTGRDAGGAINKGWNDWMRPNR